MITNAPDTKQPSVIALVDCPRCDRTTRQTLPRLRFLDAYVDCVWKHRCCQCTPDAWPEFLLWDEQDGTLKYVSPKQPDEAGVNQP